MRRRWQRISLIGDDAVVFTHLLLVLVSRTKMTFRKAVVAGVLSIAGIKRRILQIELVTLTLVGVPASEMLNHQSLAPSFLINATHTMKNISLNRQRMPIATMVVHGQAVEIVLDPAYRYLAILE